MQIRQRILKRFIWKFVVYSLHHSENSDVSHAFLPLTIAELSMLKQICFLAHPVEVGHFYFNFYGTYKYNNQ